MQRTFRKELIVSKKIIDLEKRKKEMPFESLNPKEYLESGKSLYMKTVDENGNIKKYRVKLKKELLERK